MRVDRAALARRLDHAFLQVRRVMVKPPTASMPMPELGRSVDFAKVQACLVIDDAEPPCTVKDVASALGLEHSTASRLLGDAEADGLVARHTDPDDRRRTIVELTDTGRTVVTQSTELRCWAIEEMFADWAPRDLDTLAELLERMATTVGDRVPEVIAGLVERRSCPGRLPRVD